MFTLANFYIKRKRKEKTKYEEGSKQDGKHLEDTVQL